MNIDNIDPKLWGPKWWAFLFSYSISLGSNKWNHNQKIAVLNVINGIFDTLPCQNCRDHAREYRQLNPLNIDSGEELFNYLYKMNKTISLRNNVNPKNILPSHKVYQNFNHSNKNILNDYGESIVDNTTNTDPIVPIVMMGIGAFIGYKYAKYK